jgi:hypothetical protein
MRHVKEAVRARGALAVDPKSAEGESWPERVLAWDEDETTLAIDAASHLPKASTAIVGPGIDVETFRVALDVAHVFSANDPMGVAKTMSGPVWAVGCPPGTASAVAALVVDDAGEDPKAPRDVGAAPRMVSALRALAESRRVPPAEEMPDSPMGAYVPWGTWIEDLPARLRLLAQRCEACSRAQYPPRATCAACRGRAFAPVALPPEARVYAATRIGRGGAPSEFALEQAQVGAYWVAVVEWPEQQVRVTARLWGYDEDAPAIGAPVRGVVRRLFEQEGRVRYGVKFARM